MIPALDELADKGAVPIGAHQSAAAIRQINKAFDLLNSVSVRDVGPKAVI